MMNLLFSIASLTVLWHIGMGGARQTTTTSKHIGRNSMVPSQDMFWMEAIKHQGTSPFNPNTAGYQVFRNVKDFGAKGDGKTDDSDAIK